MLTSLISGIFHFFWDNIPDISFIVKALPLSILYAGLALLFAGYCKKKLHWRTGITRKIFHFSIFFCAVIVQYTFGLSGTFVFGWGVSLVLIYTIWKGASNILYEAIAREKDAPKRTWFIIMPYLATLFGGLAANFFFAPIAAMAGYLITGIADAIAEPIGTRWGKHKYNVPTARGVVSQRSIEGSTAVFCASAISFFCIFFIRNTGLGCNAIDTPYIQIIAGAFIITLIEAISPHGWDNFTTQVAGAALFSWWMM